jgi:predicted  nucleic acid-binding Zn-ribbon protein
MAQQLEMMKLELELEEMKAGIQLDMAKAMKIQSEVQGTQSQDAVIEKQMGLAKKMAEIEKLRTDVQNVQSETMRNIPEVEHLKSETILNLALARSQSQGY